MVIRDSAPAALPPDTRWRVLFEDDFSSGLAEGHWRLRPAGDGLPDGDGVVSAGPGGLAVVPTGTDPGTGEPAFAPTAAPLGELDHLRWAAFADLSGGAGPAPAGVLEVATRMSAQGYGLERHPYGPSVADPRRELKCGAAMLVCVDRETGVVLDFVVTDRAVFAVYERLGFPGTEWAAFSYVVPVLDREPGDVHDLAIRCDGPAGSAQWLLDGEKVLDVAGIGHRVLDGRYSRRDNGGPERAAFPRQLSFGVAVFTDQVWGQGVRLAVQQFSIRQAITDSTD